MVTLPCEYFPSVLGILSSKSVLETSPALCFSYEVLCFVESEMGVTIDFIVMGSD